MKKIVISTALILILIVAGTVGAILYAQGYRFSPNNGKILQGTGLLVLTSTPEGASVYINDHLTTATNNTINLTPGTYSIRIEKDGYFAWKKQIDIKEEEVSQANATLFPNASKLDPLTTTGTSNVTVDDTNSMIAYTVSSASARSKNGIYLLNMNSRPIIPIGGLTTQLADDSIGDFTNTQLTFSPDGNQLLASVSAGIDGSTTDYLLSTQSFNNTPQDITTILSQTESDWQHLDNLQYTHTINSLPNKLRSPAKRYFGNLQLSPEEDKILYTASASGNLKTIIVPPLKGVDSTPEHRNLVKGNVYVYDIKEDRNYLIYDAESNKDKPAPHYIWHPDSDHLIYSQDSRINIEEYDGQNNTTVYAGPFDPHFLSVWPDGSYIVFLPYFNAPGTPPNLYRLSLK